jgi:ADP-ribose pyrophosphatase
MATPADRLSEKTLRTETVFEGGFLRLKRERVQLPGGLVAQREYIEHPGAVVVVPWLDSERLVLERQYRTPHRRVYVEFPAGKLDAGEPPVVCAARELREETGYRAAELAYAGALHNAIAYSNEVIHVLFARGLAPGRAMLDAGEQVEVFTESLAWLLAAIRAGEVPDAKTIIAAYWFERHLAGAWPVQWQPAQGGD